MPETTSIIKKGRAGVSDARYGLVRVRLARTTAVDYIHPTFDVVLQGIGTTPTALDPVAAASQMKTFLTGLASLPGTTQVLHLGAYLQQSIDRTGTTHEVLVYNLPTGLDPANPMGSPIHTELFTITTAASSGSVPLPDECAVCISYHGDLTGIPEFSGRTRPAARRKGRMFLGPFNSSVLPTGGTDPFVGNQTCVDFMAAWAGAFYGIPGSSGSLQPAVVWSRVDKAVYPVVKVHVNNLFDIRNARGDRRPATQDFQYP